MLDAIFGTPGPVTAHDDAATGDISEEDLFGDFDSDVEAPADEAPRLLQHLSADAAFPGPHRARLGRDIHAYAQL